VSSLRDKTTFFVAISAGVGLLLSDIQAGIKTDGSTRLDLARVKLTFLEEFKNGLDASPDGTRRWKTTYAWGNRTLAANREAEFYSDSTVGADPFAIKDGALEITAAASPGQTTPGDSGLTFTSGAITTEGSFAQRYGYFEMRAKLPAGQGLWPAFWLLPVDGSWPPELDVVEMLGHEPGVIYLTAHSNIGNDHTKEAFSIKVADTSEAYHDYGVDWEPDFITWYFDEQAVARAKTPKDMNKPMYLLINLAVGGQGSWPGPTDKTTPLPAHMRIQYVKAYRSPSAKGLATPAETANCGRPRHSYCRPMP
jgi:beta-glucanase (GH16 family)